MRPLCGRAAERWRRAAVAGLWLVGCGGSSSSGADGAPGNPTDGGGGGDDNGIAADYPGDIGIGGDPRVLFADDFESYASADDLIDRWDDAYQSVQLRIATEGPNVYAGAQSIEMTAPEQDDELSNAVSKELANEVDVLYLRYYSKYEATFDIVGSSHNGSEISAHYFVDGQATPGVPADGSNKYLIAYENWRGEAATSSPGDQNIYIYHPEQRDDYGDHFFPNGDVMPNTSIPGNFGPSFVPRPNVIPELDRWYEFEVMLQANTPGERDGRVTCWIDGEIIADFPNLYLRDVDTLTIDHFSLSLHFGSNPSGETRKWFDNVVAATAYIGPMVAP
jgi:hypothetical protein